MNETRNQQVDFPISLHPSCVLTFKAEDFVNNNIGRPYSTFSDLRFVKATVIAMLLSVLLFGWWIKVWQSRAKQ